MAAPNSTFSEPASAKPHDSRLAPSNLRMSRSSLIDIRFALVVTDNYATLATGRPATALPVPVFHRLERASFA